MDPRQTRGFLNNNPGNMDRGEPPWNGEVRDPVRCANEVQRSELVHGRFCVFVDAPHGMGTTTINGVNDAGDLVGFYTDSAGNTDGMLATAQRKVTVHLNLSAMPAGSVLVSSPGGGVKQHEVRMRAADVDAQSIFVAHRLDIHPSTCPGNTPHWRTMPGIGSRS